jgi:hypothetical protein
MCTYGAHVGILDCLGFGAYGALVAGAAEGGVGGGFGGVECGAGGGVAGLAGQALHPDEVAAGVHDGGGFLRGAAEGDVDEVLAVPGGDRRLEQPARGFHVAGEPGAALVAPLHRRDEDLARALHGGRSKRRGDVIPVHKLHSHHLKNPITKTSTT